MEPHARSGQCVERTNWGLCEFRDAATEARGACVSKTYIAIRTIRVLTECERLPPTRSQKLGPLDSSLRSE